jgi:multidrug efflux pump subunit AcrB
MRFKYITIVVTLGLFGVSVYGMGHVQQQFFPASDRPELLITMELNKNASIFATESEANRVQKILDGDPNIVGYSNYIGGGAVRFYLPLDVQLDNNFLTQFVVVAKGLHERDEVIDKLNRIFADDFPDVTVRVSRLELGPPVGWPVQYRVSAESIDDVRHYAEELAKILRASPYTQLVNFNWGEKSKTLRLSINQDKVRKAGLSSDMIAQASNMILSGYNVTQIRDSIYLIDVLARAPEEERLSLQALQHTQIPLPNGTSVPLVQFATVDYTMDESYVWRYDRFPTITVQADVPPGTQAPTAYQRNAAAINALRAKLPPGVTIVDGGTVEDSAKANSSIAAQIPLMLLLMLIVLMIQLQSFQRLFLVLSVAPLGLIGIVAIMLATNTPMGFVSTLGIIALAGMIIRNSVILVHQIEHNRSEGRPAWDAVVEAADHRLRPIMLTAAAAILGMIPIMHDVFWGPMAYAIVGGLAGATLLTMLFLPALYVAWFRIPEPRPGETPQQEREPAAVVKPV